ncbi:MAG: hypothetical protein M9885_12725 [Burkholderiaceae bacterium]|nr:hypothetical protein [Burkholderiaceae bacterium]
MAEIAMRHALHARGLRAQVSSAGVNALPDQSAHPTCIEVVARAGLGVLSSHRSRLLSSLMLGEADFVLCMGHDHRQSILARSPQYAGRVRLLGHWQGIEIADPVSGPVEGFEECLESMNDCIGQWIDRLSRQGLLQ